jgi:hypothetical protein
MLIVTPMHFSYSNKSIHYLNQDKHNAHREKCIGVSAEHASAGTRVLSASTRVTKQLMIFHQQSHNIYGQEVLIHRDHSE